MGGFELIVGIVPVMLVGIFVTTPPRR